MVAAGTGGAGANCKPSGEFGLSGGGERRSLLMAYAHPFDSTSTNGIRKRIQRIADEAEELSDSDLFECSDQNICNGSRHLMSPAVVVVLDSTPNPP
jgi:hypothetical protein